MQLFAKAATSLSYGDLTEKSIRSNNAWGLLPVQVIVLWLLLKIQSLTTLNFFLNWINLKDKEVVSTEAELGCSHY